MIPFFEKNISYRIVVGGIFAAMLSCIVFYILFLLSPFFVGFNGTDILQFMGKDNLNYPEKQGIKYLLSIETICIFLIPAILLLTAIYRKPQLILCKYQFKNKPAITMAILLVILTNIPGINLLSEINTNAILNIIGKDSEQWQAYLQMEEFTAQLLNDDRTIVNIICMALLPAICEEIFFRGFLQTIAQKVFRNIHISVICVAIIFSLLHGDMFNFFPRFILGLLLGYLFAYKQNILYSITAHATHNALVVILSIPNLLPWNSDTIGTTENNMFFGICSLIILISFIAYLIKSISKNN